MDDRRAFERYLRDLQDLPLITAEQEAELADQIRIGDREALKRLVEANLRFVVSVARQFQGQGLSLADFLPLGHQQNLDHTTQRRCDHLQLCVGHRNLRRKARAADLAAGLQRCGLYTQRAALLRAYEYQFRCSRCDAAPTQRPGRDPLGGAA